MRYQELASLWFEGTHASFSSKTLSYMDYMVAHM
jgi:hypothetical protein